MESNTVQKSQMIRRGMIIGAVAAIIASVLAFLNVKKSRTHKRPKIVRQPYVNRDSLREANIDSVLYCGDSHCQDDQQSKRNKKRDYQSGAARNNGSFYTNQNSNGASGNYFGGWDELVRDDKTQRVHRSSQDNGRPKIMEEEEENENEEEEKLSSSMQDGDLPLLLRLLVSIFPFLASWTNLL